MIKVKLEVILNDSWDGYGDKMVSEDALLQDLLITLQDQRTSQEEIVSMTILSKHLI